MVKLTAIGLTVAAAHTADAGRRMKNMQSAYKAIGTLVFQFIQRRFQAEGAHAGPAWPPLKESTKREKARLRYSPKPLIRTGALRQGWDIRPESNRVTVASTVDYSGVHQYGASSRRIPARPFLPEEDRARGIAVEALVKGVSDQMLSAFGSAVRVTQR